MVTDAERKGALLALSVLRKNLDKKMEENPNSRVEILFTGALIDSISELENKEVVQGSY